MTLEMKMTHPSKVKGNKNAKKKGVSAEVYGEYNKKKEYEPKIVPKTDTTLLIVAL